MPVRVRFSAYAFDIRIEPHPSPQHSLTSTHLEIGTTPTQVVSAGCLHAAHTHSAKILLVFVEFASCASALIKAKLATD